MSWGAAGADGGFGDACQGRIVETEDPPRQLVLVEQTAAENRRAVGVETQVDASCDQVWQRMIVDRLNDAELNVRRWTHVQAYLLCHQSAHEVRILDRA